MANIIRISELSLPELDVYARLTQAQLRNKQEKDKGLFIAEGLKVTEIALSKGVEPVSFLIEERHLEGKAARLIASAPDVPVYTADGRVLEKLTGYELTRGLLCAMRRPEEQTVHGLLTGAKRLAVLENIVDASNLGAIFRSAAALGMDGILLSPSCCDPLYRKAVRTSMGSVFQIPWARFEGKWPEEGLAALKSAGFTSYAMALRRDAMPLDEVRLSPDEAAAFILGTEGSGLLEATIENSDRTVYIPMSAGVDSLNVAAAAALAFWQLGRR